MPICLINICVSGDLLSTRAGRRSSRYRNVLRSLHQPLPVTIIYEKEPNNWTGLNSLDKVCLCADMQLHHSQTSLDQPKGPGEGVGLGRISFCSCPRPRDASVRSPSVTFVSEKASVARLCSRSGGVGFISLTMKTHSGGCLKSCGQTSQVGRGSKSHFHTLSNNE